jgi:hypothetical protein
MLPSRHTKRCNNNKSIVSPNPQASSKTSSEYKDRPGKSSCRSFKLISQAKTEVMGATINLQSEESIAEHFPLLDRCGNLAFPLHIRAFSPDLQETLTKIKQFRRKGLEEQEK